MYESAYFNELYRKIKPVDATKVLSSKISCNCTYTCGEETVLIIHGNMIEFNGEKVLCIGFIKTGINFRGYGICKKFLSDLVANCDYPVILADIVSKTLFNLISSSDFTCEKVDFTLGEEDINKDWEHYSNMYGSYKLMLGGV